MDLSKLPKLSSTPPPPENSVEGATASPAGDQRLPSTPAAGSSNIGPEFWFNAVVGLLLLFLGRRFAAYLLATVLGRPFHTGYVDDQGAEVSYADLVPHVMLTDGGIFLFGLVVLLEAGLKAFVGTGLRVPVAVAWSILVLAVVSTLFNLYVCYRFISEGSTPIMSGLAVAFGGFIIADIRRIAAASRAPRFSSP
jgi:hypothetical protein